MERKNKLKNREMLSYEDEPIEKYGREEYVQIPAAVKIKTAVIILITAAVAVLGYGLWRYISPDNLSGSLSSANVKGDGFPVKITGKSVNNSDIAIINNNFAYISDTQFQVINASGGIVVDKRIKYSSPSMVSGGNYCLIYDTEGTGYQIETTTETVFEGNAEDTIYSAEIIADGSYAILSKKDGYTSKLTVYDNNHQKKYAYSFSECYAVSISLSEDASKAVVCGLDAMKGGIISRVYVLDFTEEEPAAKIDFTEITTYKVRFLKNGNIALVGDNSSMIITNDYQNKYEFTYNGYNLINSVINEEGMVLALSPFRDGKSCEIWNISQNGSVNTIKTGIDITAMDTYKENVAILGNNQISLFNTVQEKLIKVYDVGIDVRNILYVDDDTTYLLCTSEIRQMDKEENSLSSQ